VLPRSRFSPELELVESALGCGLRVVECLLVAVVD
jgi:hypothetical protein